MMQKRIILFGGGIGNLVVAHQLSKFPEYKIEIYEKKGSIGGLARSARDVDLCSQEYCWRVFFGFYDNLLGIMGEIPLIENPSKTTLDNLTIYNHLNIDDNPVSLKDDIIGIYNVLYGVTSGDKRMIELDNVTWWDALKNTANPNIYKTVPQWLGMHKQNASFRSVIDVGMEMQIIKSLIDKNYVDYVTTKPTSEALFDHWKVYLERKGVIFHMHNELSRVNIRDDKIISTIVYDNENNRYKNVIGDIYVFGLPVEGLDKLIDNNPELNRGQLTKIKELKDLSLHIQLSFQIFFNKEISLGYKDKNKGIMYNAFLINQSPWDLIILAYDKIFVDTKLCYNMPSAKSAWSVAACTADAPGIVFGKPMNKCNYEEIVIELWAQMVSSQELQRVIKENNNFELSKDLIIKWAPMWSTYHYNEKTGRLETDEPKFTNNAGTLILRPSFKTDIDNLYISTAYVREGLDIFSMESATIVGKKVANAINNNSSTGTIRPRPFIFAPFRFLDDLLYDLHIPNLGPLLIILVILTVLGLSIYFIYKLFTG